MTDQTVPRPSRTQHQMRRSLAPDMEDAFSAFSRAVFRQGALDTLTKQLIAVAVSHVTQCPWCIDAHIKAARREGATPSQLMEAVWVAAEMRAGAAFAHCTRSLALLTEDKES